MVYILIFLEGALVPLWINISKYICIYATKANLDFAYTTIINKENNDYLILFAFVIRNK